MVYVDPEEFINTNFHLIADTLDELHRFARRLKLKKSWFQNTMIPHYCLSKGNRFQAVKKGACEDTAKYMECLRTWRKLRRGE